MESPGPTTMEPPRPTSMEFETSSPHLRVMSPFEIRRRARPRLALLLLATACAPAGAPFDDAARAAVEAAIDSATRAFEAAERARDAEAVLAHMAPEFTMLVDGVRSGYDDVVAQTRATMPTLRVFDGEWTDLAVRALGPDAGVASFRFRDFIVTAEGDTLELQGPTTLVWERRGDGWLITYADADHYPVPDDDGR